MFLVTTWITMSLNLFFFPSFHIYYMYLSLLLWVNIIWLTCMKGIMIWIWLSVYNYICVAVISLITRVNRCTLCQIVNYIALLFSQMIIVFDGEIQLTSSKGSIINLVLVNTIHTTCSSLCTSLFTPQFSLVLQGVIKSGQSKPIFILNTSNKIPSWIEAK